MRTVERNSCSMKIKYLILLTLFLLESDFLFAQLKMGPVAGSNISNWSPENINDPGDFGLSSAIQFEKKYSFHIGAILDNSITKNFGFQCSLILSMLEAKAMRPKLSGSSTTIQILQLFHQ